MGYALTSPYTWLVAGQAIGLIWAITFYWILKTALSFPLFALAFGDRP
jgi:hypothetical protein